MDTITTGAELSQAISAESSVIFLWVDWSIHARQSEALVRSAIDALPAEAQVRAFKIDVSSQEGELWNEVRDWLRSAGQDYDRLTIGGYGSVLLCKERRVVMSIVFPASRLPDGIPQSDLVRSLIALQKLPKED